MEGCVGLSTQAYSSAWSGVASGRQMEGCVGLSTQSFSSAWSGVASGRQMLMMMMQSAVSSDVGLTYWGQIETSA